MPSVVEPTSQRERKRLFVVGFSSAMIFGTFVGSLADKYGRKHHDKCKKKLTNKLLQGDIIEHPDYIMENNLKMDYRYYLEHQIIFMGYHVLHMFMTIYQNIYMVDILEA